MMRRATAYLRKGQLLIQASSRTTAGVWIDAEPCLAMPESSDDQALGAAIRAALDGSRMDVPHPQNWSAVQASLLRAANVKSWSTFSKNAACVEIAESDERVSVTPMKNLGADDGFEEDPSRQVVLEQRANAPAQLGSVVRRLLVGERSPSAS